MRGVIAVLAGAALVVPAVAGAQAVRAGASSMSVGHAGGGMRTGGWGAGGWGGGMRAGGGFVGRPGGGVVGHPGYGVGHGGFVGRPGFGGGFVGYRRPFVGYVVPNTFISPTYYIGNWSSYGLASPAAGYNWYRYYDDAVMVDGGGRVRDWRGGVNWAGGRGDKADRAYDNGYDDGYGDGYDDGVDYAEDAVTYRGKAQRGVPGWRGELPPPAGAPLMPPPPMRDGWRDGYGYNSGYRYQAGPGTTVWRQPGGATVVTVQTAPSVATTTTTTTTTYETVRPKRVWHAPAKRRMTKGKTLCRC